VVYRCTQISAVEHVYIVLCSIKQLKCFGFPTISHAFRAAY